jgi:hypothetical protein
VKKVQVALVATIMAMSLTPSSASAASLFKDATVFTDPEGDARVRGHEPPDKFGLDLVQGRIKWASSAPELITFEATMTSMWEENGTPLFGSQGEWARLVWHFAVGKHQYRLTMKTRDLGKPDAFSGSGLDRVGQLDAYGHYRLEECTTGTSPIGTDAVFCETIEYLDGFIEVLPATIRTYVPASSIGVRSGSVIKVGTGGLADVGCEVCWVVDVAERADDPEMIVDAADVTRIFRMP